MILKSLNFDIKKWLKNLFAPYAALLSSLTILVTALLTVVLWVPSIRQALDFHQWDDLSVIALGLAWFVGVTTCFMLILHALGISLKQFGNLFVYADVILLTLIIVVTSLIPGQQTCSMGDADCTTLDNFILSFLILQIPILGMFMSIKLRRSRRNTTHVS